MKKQCPTFEEGKLERIVRESRTAKGRALHYFPIEEFTSEECGEKSCQSTHDVRRARCAVSTTRGRVTERASYLAQADVSSWCGWHNDHGSLTGLVPAMYMSKEGAEVTNPDPSSGLYIRARNGDLVKAVIPSEYMVFQIGTHPSSFSCCCCACACCACVSSWAWIEGCAAYLPGAVEQARRRASIAEATCRLRRTACEVRRARRPAA